MGDIHLACSQYTLAQSSDATFWRSILYLHQGHPYCHLPLSPQTPFLSLFLKQICFREIKSLPNSSAVDLNGLQPSIWGSWQMQVMNSPTPYCSDCLFYLGPLRQGISPFPPYFFGVNLITLEKKVGGVWPIAVGCTFAALSPRLQEAGDEGYEWPFGGSFVMVSQLELRHQSMLCSTPKPLCSGVIGLFIQQKEYMRDPWCPLLLCLATYRLGTQLSAKFCAGYRKGKNIGKGGPSQAIICKTSFLLL